MQEVEDEFHFIICCSLLKQTHEKLFSDLSEIFDTVGMNSNDLFQLIMTAKDYDVIQCVTKFLTEGNALHFTE